MIIYNFSTKNVARINVLFNSREELNNYFLIEMLTFSLKNLSGTSKLLNDLRKINFSINNLIKVNTENLICSISTFFRWQNVEMSRKPF